MIIVYLPDERMHVTFKDEASKARFFKKYKGMMGTVDSLSSKSHQIYDQIRKFEGL